jgi:hypothetical protein
MTLMMATLAQVPDAVGLLSEPVQEVVAEPASAWSWTLPLVGGAVLLGVSLVCAGAWFAWNRRQATRDRREVATHALAKRAGLSTPELQAIEDLVACVHGNHEGKSGAANEMHSATTLGLIMSPHAAAELARSLPISAMDGFDRKQLGRALEKLGAAGSLEIKPKNKGKAKIGGGASVKGAMPVTRAMPTKGNEAIAMRARAVLAAIQRAKEQGYFDAKTGGPAITPPGSQQDQQALKQAGTTSMTKSAKARA